MDTKNSNYEQEVRRLAANLVDIRTLTEEFAIDMRYATEDNFIGRAIYSVPLCAMQLSTARKLIKANRELMEKGFRIKIWDAYRPFSAQKLMWDIMPVDGFVANPNKGGSIHNGGFAVDVTLVDRSGKELEMPTGFDDFTGKASRQSSEMNETAAKNLAVLTDAMVRHGFRTINSEWWHYYDEDLKERIPLDIPLEAIAGCRPSGDNEIKEL
ncbi:MAG TPA: M15 family metallopeptidase [Clostridia bacterium]|nr:M15 family metallopeptidase [Clostridia bacterium]